MGLYIGIGLFGLVTGICAGWHFREAVEYDKQARKKYKDLLEKQKFDLRDLK